jgi:tryptophanase
VSLENIRACGDICRKHKVPLFIDAARVIENAYFIKRHEPGMGRLSIKGILRETMAAADGMLMSAKKDGIVNIGGFLAVRDEALYEALRDYTILFDGFATYGGLAGRDLAAIAVGLYEATEIDYLEFRVGQVRRLGEMIKSHGITIVEPTGGHAVYFDGRSFCPHIKPEHFPAHSVTLELYLEGGVRSVEIGYILRGRDPVTGKNRFDGLDLVRLAVPRRVYSVYQLDYVADVCGKVKKNAASVRGVRFTKEGPRLRHFVSEFEFV